MSDNDQTKIEFEESSGNVFADLGLKIRTNFLHGRNVVFMSPES
jgi:hypothetical protein